MCEFDINGYMQNNTKFVFLSVETLSASRGFRYMYIIFKSFSENSAPGPLLVNGGREGKGERINRSWPPDKIPASPLALTLLGKILATGLVPGSYCSRKTVHLLLIPETFTVTDCYSYNLLSISQSNVFHRLILVAHFLGLCTVA